MRPTDARRDNIFRSYTYKRHGRPRAAVEFTGLQRGHTYKMHVSALRISMLLFFIHTPCRSGGLSV